MVDPKFEPDVALFIIWRRPRRGGMHTLAAGSFKAMKVAWEELQGDYPADELTLQHRARILMRRAPMLD
jgi:hypothetical protein